MLKLHFREFGHEFIIPGLPDDLALRCLAKISHGYHGILESVSRGWRDLLRSSEYAHCKASEGWCGDWLFVLTEQSNNQWIAYDPDADRWHPLPKISDDYADCQHFGFSCVSINNRLLLIGGSYLPHNLSHPHQTPFITNHVLQFDPFNKKWTNVATMHTPRSHFACSVISGKVYVAGGRNLSCSRGLALAEVYDPLTDTYVHLCLTFGSILLLLTDCSSLCTAFFVFLFWWISLVMYKVVWLLILNFQISYPKTLSSL